tara:strand:+ start:1957 stop:2061 length:105 start_codon:yes stop_codon:yes gene_type:complete
MFFTTQNMAQIKKSDVKNLVFQGVGTRGVALAGA